MGADRALRAVEKRPHRSRHLLKEANLGTFQDRLLLVLASQCDRTPQA